MGANESYERIGGDGKGWKVLAMREVGAGPDFHAETQRRREIDWDE
jgi:hypothetical protein